MVYSEHTPVELKQHKKQENDQWRLPNIFNIWMVYYRCQDLLTQWYLLGSVEGLITSLAPAKWEVLTSICVAYYFNKINSTVGLFWYKPGPGLCNQCCEILKINELPETWGELPETWGR